MNEPERRTGGEVDIDPKVGAKFLLAMVGGLVAALLVISIISRLSSDDAAPAVGEEGDAAADPIALTVDTGQPETEPIEYELPYQAQSTLFELMQAAEEPAFEHRGEGESALLESLDGVEADIDAELYWRYYVNGKLAEEGFGAYIVQPGDVILWKREKTD